MARFAPKSGAELAVSSNPSAGVLRGGVASFGSMLGVSPRQAIIFYIGIPVLIGFLSGWPQAGRTSEWPKGLAIAFWVLLSLGGWWINDLLTRISAKILRPYGAPLSLVLIVGVLLAAFPTDFYFVYVAKGFYAVLPDLPVGRGLPEFDWSAQNWLRTHMYGIIIWPLANLACYQLLQMPRYGYSRLASTVNLETPGFIPRIPAKLGREIVAIKAEQHYIRVYTKAGDALVLYRFSDAIREMGKVGVQVHRGFWVSRNAIERVEGDKNAPKLILRNGLEVPVSRSFKQISRLEGIL